MDLIYKIYGVWLYDNQLEHEFLILNNRTTGYLGQVNWDLPYTFSGTSSYGALYKIYNLPDDKDKKSKSIQIMKDESEREGLPFIKNDGFLTLVKTGTPPAHNPRYCTYDIYWNETKSGINIHDYEVLHIWHAGDSSYSSYRIWEEKAERESQLRDYKLQSILN